MLDQHRQITRTNLRFEIHNGMYGSEWHKMYNDCWTLQCSCLIKRTWCAKHALCVGLFNRTYFAMWGKDLEECLVNTGWCKSHLTLETACETLSVKWLFFGHFCVLSYLDFTFVWRWLWMVDWSENCLLCLSALQMSQKHFHTQNVQLMAI
jgi:hypothetical protein